MTKKILLVEDDLLMVRAIQSLLSSRGFEVDSALDGEEALEKINDSYHCVVLDIKLPGKDGFEVLKHFKGNEKVKHIPVVVCTKLNSEEDRKKASDLGAHSFVNKARDNLLEAVEAVMEG